MNDASIWEIESKDILTSSSSSDFFYTQKNETKHEFDWRYGIFLAYYRNAAGVIDVLTMLTPYWLL